MALFYYIATDTSNNSQSGTLEAIDRSAAIASLNRQSLRPISIREGDPKKSSFSIEDFFGKNRVKADHLVLFTRQLSAMVSAGVPILRALTSLQEHSESPTLKTIIAGVIKDVESGTSKYGTGR